MKRRVTAVTATRLDLRSFLVAGAGLAVLWLFAYLAFHPAPAAASEGTTTLLRGGTFGSLSESSDRPIHRRRYREPYDYGYRQGPKQWGFLTLGGGLFDPASQPGNGFYGVTSVGTEIGHSLDLGVQASWYHRGSEGDEFVSTYKDPAGNTVEQSIQTQSVDTDLVPLMGIVRVRFPTPQQFQPYFGGGVGYEWLFVDGVDDQGFDFHNDYGGFGAQVLAGVSLMAAPTMGVYGEAVYNFSTVSSDFFDPALNTVIHESIDMDGLALHGGLRFRF